MRPPVSRIRLSDPLQLVGWVLLLAGVSACGSKSEPGDSMKIRRTAEALDEILSDAESPRTENLDAPIQKGTFETIAKKDAGKLYLGGERPALLMAPDAEVTWALEIPANAELSFAAGIAKESQPLAPRVRFEVEIDERSVFDHVLDPTANASDRDWVPHTVRLDELAGREARITLRTTLENPAESPDAAAIRCGFGTPRITTTESRTRTVASDERPNLIYICVDTVRADHLSCYGHDRPTSPNVDRLAAAGVRYAVPVSVSPWTWPSTASLLTGLYPYTHGVLWSDQCYLPSEAQTIAEQLQGAGFTTYAISANPLVCKPQNFDQGFEHFEEAFQERADELTDRFLAWQKDQGQRRFFAYLHYFDPHYRYDPPEGLRYVEEVLGRPIAADERPHFDAMRARQENGVDSYRGQEEHAEVLTALYDAEIRFWDSQIGRLLDELAARGVLDKTMIVITSDHGEEFFEHGRVGHSLTLHDELTIVPLILHYPARLDPTVIETQVETLSLPPTLLALMGVDVPEAMVDHRLPLRPGEAPPRAGFSTTERWIDPSIKRRNQNSIRNKDWKLIYVPGDGAERPSAYRLFHLAEDPGETIDVAPKHPDVAERLLEKLKRWMGETTIRSLKSDWASESISSELTTRLEELGYVTGNDEPPAEEGDEENEEDKRDGPSR